MSGPRPQAAVPSVRITTWDRRYANDFVRLNLAWLVGYHLYEEGDRKHLERPEETILACPGEIFFAIDDGAGGSSANAGPEDRRIGAPDRSANVRVLGSCAVAFQPDGAVEILKFAVDESARSRGIGTRLLQAAIDWARDRGAALVKLESSTKLKAALRLYERFGFEHKPFAGPPTYVTADVYMEKSLRADAV